MIWQVCNESAEVLIRGKCKDCDPIAHRNHTEALEDEGPDEEEAA